MVNSFDLLVSNTRCRLNPKAVRMMGYAKFKAPCEIIFNLHKSKAVSGMPELESLRLEKRTKLGQEL